MGRRYWVGHYKERTHNVTGYNVREKHRRRRETRKVEEYTKESIIKEIHQSNSGVFHRTKVKNDNWLEQPMDETS